MKNNRGGQVCGKCVLRKPPKRSGGHTRRGLEFMGRGIWLRGGRRCRSRLGLGFLWMGRVGMGYRGKMPEGWGPSRGGPPPPRFSPLRVGEGERGSGWGLGGSFPFVSSWSATRSRAASGRGLREGCGGSHGGGERGGDRLGASL